jgi:transcriptional regulator with PAS, ATPase and Fis domain
MRITSPQTQTTDCLQFEKIITSSDPMLAVFDQASRAAEVDATVLITGESGTGKELIAEAIHYHGPRREGPYVIINMAAVPANLIESELFGYVDGAFTGAAGKRVGRFEAAHQGTLFIDEIGDLAIECQAKLLRVLENHRISPVGSNEERELDVRVIAATSRNLGQMVRAGEFREELYYRLNVISIALPPLRERPEDIPLLVHHFLQEFSAVYDRPDPQPDEELMQWLCSHRWPGNIRQLRNCVESMFVLAESSTLTIDNLPKTICRPRKQEAPLIEVPDGFTLEDVERAVVCQTLERYNGNRTRAAKVLGISVRTLERRLKKWKATQEGLAQ